MKGKGIVGPMGVEVVYPKNVGECRGMETDDYAPIMLSMNTSRLSSTSYLRTCSSYSWLWPRLGRAH